MNNKKLLLLGLSSLLLISCGQTTGKSQTTTSEDDGETSSISSTQPLTFAEVYQKLQGPLTLNGEVKEVLVTENGETPLISTIKVMFGSNSFHIEQTGESELTSTVYKSSDETPLALHYYITEQNTVESEVIQENGEDVPFKNYDNPFKYVSSDNFKDNGDNTYSFKMEDSNLSDLYFASGNITYLLIEDMAEAYQKNVIEDFTLAKQNDDLTTLHIKTINLTDATGTRYFDYSFTIDYSSETEHDYPLPTPLTHEDYHTALQTAIDNLINGTYVGTGSYDYGGIIYYFTYAVSPSLLYIYDETYEESVAQAYIKDELHEVTELNGTFYYKESVLSDEEALPWPSQSVATEWFSYDETNNEYTLTGTAAGYLAYTLIPYSAIDPTIVASTELVITLGSDGNIQTLIANAGSVLVGVSFDFSDPTMPFNVNELEVEPDILTVFAGTYEFTLTDETKVTLIVTKDGITWNGTSCTVVGENRYGELEFEYDGDNYSISTNGRIYNNTTGDWYSYQKTA